MCDIPIAVFSGIYHETIISSKFVQKILKKGVINEKSISVKNFTPSCMDIL